MVRKRQFNSGVKVSSGGKWMSGHTAGWIALANSIENKVTPTQVHRGWIEDREEQFAAMAAMGLVVYAVWTHDKLIKIGITANIRTRLERYRISGRNMHRLLLVTPGNLQMERTLHRMFAEHLERGREFFRPAPEIIYYINLVRDRMGVPPVDLDRLK